MINLGIFDVFLDVPSATLWLKPSVFSKWHFPKKKTNGRLRTYFLEYPHWNFLDFLFYPRKFQKKQSFTLETPQNFVTSLGTFKPWNQDPWKFHPGNSTLNSPFCFCFFWNSPMTGVQVVYILGNFCWYRTCSSQVLNFQMLFYQQKLSFQAAFGWFFWPELSGMLSILFDQ